LFVGIICPCPHSPHQNALPSGFVIMVCRLCVSPP
jgi:hypothetical protein